MAQGTKPDFIVTGRMNGDNKTWANVGAAWHTTTRDGKPYISVRVKSIPINWDGTLALHEPSDVGEEGGA